MFVTSLATAQERFKIGALIKNTSNPFFLTMADGLNFAAERHGVEIVIGSAINDGDTDGQLAVLEGWLIVGFIIWGLANIVVFFSNEKRRVIHDYIAGTVVVRTNIDDVIKVGEKEKYEPLIPKEKQLKIPRPYY